MGVVVSSPTPTSPFFLITGIIGIVSFAFTLGTFFKVVWSNIETMTEAEHEVHTYLTNLRQELLEEKHSIRIMKKGMRKHHKACKRDGTASMLGIELDDVTLKTMGDNIRQLCRRFRDLERPFLEEGEPGIEDAPNHRKVSRRRHSSLEPPRYSHAAYGSPNEKSRPRSNHNRNGDAMPEQDDDEDMYWAQRTQYANFTLKRRMQWLTRKANAQQLLEALSRVQLRRMARQVGGMAVCMHEYGQATFELRESVQRVDERVGRVVGVRRVD